MPIQNVIEQLESEIENLTKAVKLLKNGEQGVTVKRITRRKMAPAAIEKMREAARKRWAAVKKKTPASKGA